MAEIELIGVPFDGYGRPGNQARAASALRAAGLLDAFEHHHVAEHCELALPAGDPARGPSSLINERALLAMTRALNERIGSAVPAGRLPIVYGGGAGHYAAEWIIDGQPSDDMWELDVRRFGDYSRTTQYVASRACEVYER